MCISIVTGFQNGRLTSWEIDGFFFWKCSFWNLISKIKIGCMRIACFIFYLFTVNAFFFSSLNSCLRMHLLILTGVQTWRIIGWKNGHFCRRCLFWSLIVKVEVSCMRMTLLIFWQLGQKFDFSVPNNLFGQLSDLANQQPCFYLDTIPLI